MDMLENETVRIGDVAFAGATLWTDFALRGDPYRAMITAGDRMNDYKKIRIAASDASCRITLSPDT